MPGLFGEYSSLACPLDAQPKASFRSCGREAPGRHEHARELQRTHAPGTKGPPATIPSRIETTLFKGNRESYGFGSHSLRFDGGTQQALPPGPGAYKLGKTFLEEHGDKACWGIRGTGGFASRSKRFGSRSAPAIGGKGCPGPGAYEPLKAIALTRDRKEFSQASASAVFTHGKPAPGAYDCGSVAVPGPGAYDVLDKKVFDAVKEPQCAKSAFRSATLRGHGADVPSGDPGPGPGAYECKSSIPLLSEMEGSEHMFKQPARRKVVSVHPDLPAGGDRARERMGDFAKEVARICAGYNLDKPGPGTYEKNRDAMWQNNAIGRAGSSSFLPSSQRTDWGRMNGKEAALVPGPGGYDPIHERKLPLPSAASAFISGTERNKSDDGRVPGPAFYAPPGGTLEKRAFHWNAEKKWV